MPLNLSGKIAAITGPTSGIGFECAKSFINAGAKVVMVHYSEEKLAKVCELLGANAIPLVIDITDNESVKTMMPAIIEKAGKLDIFLANAGSYVGGQFVDSDPDEWTKMLAVNVNAVFYCVHAILPYMIEKKCGDIIVTGSIAGMISVAHEPVYCPSKHAVQAFVHSVRRQISPYGIRIGSVLPGPVVTKMLNDWPKDKLDAAKNKGAFIGAEEVAECVMFMATRNHGVTIRDIVVLPTTLDV